MRATARIYPYLFSCWYRLVYHLLPIFLPKSLCVVVQREIRPNMSYRGVPRHTGFATEGTVDGRMQYKFSSKDTSTVRSLVSLGAEMGTTEVSDYNQLQTATRGFQCRRVEDRRCVVRLMYHTPVAPDHNLIEVHLSPPSGLQGRRGALLGPCHLRNWIDVSGSSPQELSYKAWVNLFVWTCLAQRLPRHGFRLKWPDV